MKKDIIAIIDDGISEYFESIGKLHFNIQIIDKNNAINIKNNTTKITHGTICAAIIKKYNPDAFIGSLKIIDEEQHNCNIEKLIYALEWCLKESIKIINISLGTIKYVDYIRIQQSVNNLVRKGCKIICACHSNYLAAPACITGVIGVKYDYYLSDNQYKKILFSEYVNFYASSNHIIKFKTKIFATPKCNSFACPVITSTIEERKMNLDSSKRIRLDFMTNFYAVGNVEGLIYSMLNYKIKEFFTFFQAKLLIQTLMFENDKQMLVIFTKNSNEKEICIFLKTVISLAGNKIFSIVIAGYCCDELENILKKQKKIYYWTENSRLIFKNVKKKFELLINIENETEIIYIMDFIKNVLAEKMDPIVLSDIQYSYLYGIEYLSNKDNINDVLSYYYNSFEFDIIIVISKNYIEYKFDYNIIINNDYWVFLFKRKLIINIKAFIKFNRYIVKKLIKRIMGK